MFGDDLLLGSKLIPPRRHRRTLARPAWVTRWRAGLGYHLTVLLAGATYGKTAAPAALGDGRIPRSWCRATHSQILVRRPAQTGSQARPATTLLQDNDGSANLFHFGRSNDC
jgi:hypothetical protein